MINSLLQKCWILALLALLWALGSAYWYTCYIKYACTVTAPIAVAHYEMQPLVVYFGADSDNILTEGIDANLHKTAEYLAQVSGTRVRITGHTNVHSNHAYTDTLGLERAEKVEALLVSYGAPAGSIETVSKGQDELAASPTTQEAQSLNRRAIITEIK